MSCKSHKSSGCTLATEQLLTPKAIVRHYETNFCKMLNEHLAFYKTCNLETCLRQSPLGQTYKPNQKGLLKRHSHQSCIKTSAASCFVELLLKKQIALSSCQSFSELFKLIENIACDPKCSGVGPLCVFDTAQRIGIHLGLEPKEIYLHAGVLKGAENIGIQTKGIKSIPVTHNKIPKELQKYNSIHLENILCIYKDALVGPLDK